MTNTYNENVCLACGTNVKLWAECPFCGETNFVTVERDVPKIVNDDDIKEFMLGIFGSANGYIVSGYKCFCGDDHKMVWPGLRDKTNYSNVRSLTRLPVCPVRLWTHSSKKGFPVSKEKFLEGVR